MPTPDFSETEAMVQRILGDKPRSMWMLAVRLMANPSLRRKLDQVEAVLGEEGANRWFVQQLVATGMYEGHGDYVKPVRLTS
jgi:hypothetical protein